MSEQAQTKTKHELGFDFTKSRNQMLIIQAVRIGFLLAILFITVIFQAFQPEFVNIEVLLPLYLLMSFSFALNALYLVFLERALRMWPTTAILFFYESVFITCLIYYTGINQSIFLFLYLVNIILCGFVFLRRGAFFLSLWTSILFSLLVIIGPEIQGQTLFFAVGLNNLAFFAVAALSGVLSEQLNFMGSALQAQGKDIRALKNLNTLIIDNMSTGLMTINQKGMIVQANRAAIQILSPLPSSIVSRNLSDVVPGLTEMVLEFGLSQGENAAERFDFHYKNPFDEKLTLEITVSALPTDSEIGGYVITFQNLTRVRQLEFQMRQSEKMAAVGQLAAGIAHEIRNPLASISGSIQLLGSSFSSRQEEEHKLMAIVLREIDRLNNLITEFLDFVRPDTLRDDPINVNDLLRDVLELTKLNKAVRQDVQQRVRFEATEQISGHRDKMKQALLNIIINAYQAMNDSTSPSIEVSTLNQEDRVIIKIKDSGCGMDEIGLRRLFEPFHTTKPKGTGLGLAVTHKIIENHGGKVYVESTKGVGTEFTLDFPVRTEQGLDKNALADSQRASENFSIAFRGQKRGHG